MYDLEKNSLTEILIPENVFPMNPQFTNSNVNNLIYFILNKYFIIGNINII